jgi:RNA polymerase sigma-70 factor (ECF subfamily)
VTESTQDDLDLLAACAAGDERALGSLYDRHGRVSYVVALRVLRDSALAEDAVQEAFLAVWRQAATYDPARGKALTWILMLVHRRAVDLVRRERRAGAALGELAAAPAPAGESVDGQVSLRSDVRAALRTLTHAEREVLGLAYWGGLTQSQIATTLGVPLGTVKSRTSAALGKLRDGLLPAPPVAVARPRTGRRLTPCTAD